MEINEKVSLTKELFNTVKDYGKILTNAMDASLKCIDKKNEGQVYSDNLSTLKAMLSQLHAISGKANIIYDKLNAENIAKNEKESSTELNEINR